MTVFHIRQLKTSELTADETAAIKDLLWAAFEHDEHGAFTEDDWQHSIGGVHFLVEDEGRILAHASVVERELQVGGVPLRTGYVEAVATAPADQGKGYGSAVMHRVNEHVAAHFQLGALGTGSQGFYERLGWRIWPGQSFVRTADGDRATPEEDGYIMYLLTSLSPALDPSSPISCVWRPGDVW